MNLLMVRCIIPPDDKQPIFILPMVGIRIFFIRHILSMYCYAKWP